MPHQLEIRGVGPRRPAALITDPQGCPLGRRRFLGANDFPLPEYVDDQVTPRQGPLGMPPRVIAGRSLDEGYQQGRLGDSQLVEGAVEIEVTRQAEAVDGPLTILAERDLVGIGLQDLILAVMQVEQNGHHGLGELARQGALVGQVEVLDQLLGQGAAALDHPAGPQIAPHGADDGPGIHPPVAVKVPILYRQQGFEHERRQIRTPDQDPVLVVGGVNARDQHRVEAHQVRIDATGGVFEPGHPAVLDPDVQDAFGLGAVPETEGPGVYQEEVLPAGVGPQIVRGLHPAIPQTLQLAGQCLHAQRPAHIELERPG